ncbi:MAG: hypothetical protein PHY79_18090 [Anaerolineae bacterium]|nr:hypothetical protein [Anaerolineae bacterium]
MRKKRPVAAKLEDVIIRRKATSVEIEYKDPEVASVTLELGRPVGEMSDEDILDLFNKSLRAQRRMRVAYDHRAIEIPEGRPQIKFDEGCRKWVPRGDVLRCIVEDWPPGGTTIIIDEHELSLEEFGGMLNAYAGWGMRIVFVPDDELGRMPDIVMCEAEEEERRECRDQKGEEMGDSVIEMPRLAEPNIDAVLEGFIVEQRERLKPATLRKYEYIVDLMRIHMNGYGSNHLSKREKRMYEALQNSRKMEEVDFCSVFGPEKIVDNLDEFLGYFIVRKVNASQEDLRSAGTVTKKLSRWLFDEGHISEESSREGFVLASEATRVLPRAEKAAQLIFEYVDNLPIDPDDLEDEDYIEYDHFVVDMVEPKRIWLRGCFMDDTVETLGPIPLPMEVTELLKEGWTMGCALGRLRGKWIIVESGNIYPL